MDQEEKEKTVKSEKRKIKKLFKDIDENKLNFVETLIDRLAWLNVSVKELEDAINADGTTVEYDNGGGQSGVKDNPDVKTLIQYTRNITTITKQLIELVPAKSKKSMLQQLMDD